VDRALRRAMAIVPASPALFSIERGALDPPRAFWRFI